MAPILERWREETLRFTEETTAHGLGRVGSYQRPIWYRLIWLALVLAGMAVALINCENRIREFKSHPFNMKETLEPQAKFSFPAVTVCSVFPLPVLGNASEKTRAVLDQTKDSLCYNDTGYREQITDDLGASEEVMLFSALDGKLDEVGHSAKSLIAGCRFNNQHCSYLNFTRYTDPDFFNCYTLDTGQQVAHNKQLTLLLYLSSAGKFYNFTDVLELYMSGIIIQVHESNVHPAPLKLGRAILPGTYNVLSLQTYRTELLTAPVLTNCTNRTLPNTVHKYNIDICYKTCLQEIMTKQCGCAYAGIHINKPYGYDGSFCLHDYCNTTQLVQQAQCIKEFYNNVDQYCHECTMPPCLQWDFVDRHLAVDYFIDFPADNFVNDFLNPDHPAIGDMIDAFGNVSNVPKNFISKNFAEVTVTFADMHIRHKVAVRSMSSFSLFSDLGGAFSFWIGCSIMTFVEIIEWTIRMVIAVRYNQVQSDGEKTQTKS